MKPLASEGTEDLKLREGSLKWDPLLPLGALEPDPQSPSVVQDAFQGRWVLHFFRWSWPLCLPWVFLPLINTGFARITRMRPSVKDCYC